MKQHFWLVQRRGVFYLQDTASGTRTSLETRDRKEAERLFQARVESLRSPTLGLTLGRAYLAAYDPKLAQRTWADVMTELTSRGRSSTQERYGRAIQSDPMVRLRTRKLLETAAEDLHRILADGKPSTNHFLRRLHNFAVGIGWLPWPVIPAKLWPTIRIKARRGITLQEHQRILEAEGNPERKAYYQLLWETGAAQSDGAALGSTNVDWHQKVLSFQRCKTGEWCRLTIGPSLEELLKGLPATGLLFPTIAKSTASARSAEFSRRTRLLGLRGVSLHCYRYAWAERALSSGYPERWAQAALGHGSKAVHRAYARSAFAVCPPLEHYGTPPTVGRSSPIP